MLLADGDERGAQRYDAALGRYLAADAPGFDERFERALRRVGLAADVLEHPATALSGGQRTRVNLAMVLVSTADILLLDEPTNDLDLDGIALVEEFLDSTPAGAMIVSHDRAFLERTVRSVAEIDQHTHGLTLYNGGYQAWLEAREIARRHAREAYEDYASQRDALRRRAQREREWSTKGVRRAKKDLSERDRSIRHYRTETSENLAGRARRTERAIERLDEVEEPRKEWELRLEFPVPERSGNAVVMLRDAVVRRPGFVLGPVTLDLQWSDRVLVTGPNGSGKSTLLGLMLGDLQPSEGTAMLGSSVLIGRMGQVRAPYADAASLLEGYVSATGMTLADARSQLAKLGLDVERINRRAVDLSPGEQTRTLLAEFASTGCNLLVLDEPTNHLDLPAVEQLEEALDDFPGTVLLVTHDRRLRDAFRATREWQLHAGTLTEP